MGNLRVLYLHALESGPGTLKHKYLDVSFDVYCPRLHSDQWMSRIRAYALLFILAYIGFVTSMWVHYTKWPAKFPLWVAIVGTIGLLLFEVVFYYFFMRYMLRCQLSEAVDIADKAAEDWDPDIIVGASFGGVVALHMETTKIPLLLLAPANELFHSWAGIKDKPDLSPYPYTTIVHGALDQTVPLQHSLTLCETTRHNVNLEVISQDDHRLTSLADAELYELVWATIQRVDKNLAKRAEAARWYVAPKFPEPPRVAVPAARAEPCYDSPADEAGGSSRPSRGPTGPRAPSAKTVGKALPEDV